MLHSNNLTIEHAGYVYLQDISFSLEGKNKRKIAIIGQNGSGKSSLMKVLAGLEEPYSGTITTHKETIAYIPQQASWDMGMLVKTYLESHLEEIWMEYKILQVIEMVHLPESCLIKTLGTLSGGEQMKLMLASALLCEPTILLLDETTNHLDAEAICFLGTFIQKFSGTVLLITHERTFISKYMTEIWEIDTVRKHIVQYTGNYEAYLEQKACSTEQQIKEYEQYQREIEELVLWLKANEFHPKYRFSDRVLSKKKSLESLQKNQPMKPYIRPAIQFSKTYANEERRLLKVHIIEKKYEDVGILQDMVINLRVGDKLRIMGANGSGKSTVLKIIAGIDAMFHGTRVESEHVKIGYLPQTHNFPKNKTLLTYVAELLHSPEHTARSLLANALIPMSRIQIPIHHLSYGEQKRVMLALLLHDHPDVLILDEPTNHLDIGSREDLEILLKEVQTLVYVSHDEYFVQSVGVTQSIQL